MSKPNRLSGVTTNPNHPACAGISATTLVPPAEMVNERGIDVHHTTVFRWVQEYGPELDKRCRPHLRPTNDSWRVDETYIEVKEMGVPGSRF